MEFGVKSGSAEKQRSACIIVGVFQSRRLSPVAEQLDKASDGYISALLRRGELEGNIGQSLLLHQIPNVASERILLVGCGKERDFDMINFKKVIENSIAATSETGSMEAINFLTELPVKSLTTYWKVRLAIEATREAIYNFDQFKTTKVECRRSLRKMIFSIHSRRELHYGELALQHGIAIANGVHAAKDLGNLPPNICNPAYLAEEAKKLVKSSDKKLKVTIIDEKQMKELGMNAYLAVSQGSRNDALMTIMEYNGNPNRSTKPIVLIGKGLTFDSGGISLKPAQGMDEMKYDMCGAASIFGVITALIELKLPINIVGIMAGCENMPDGQAARPGDIVTTMSGKTVEILNTDAEGRLVLCDALTYAEKFAPETVIDVATLTGACVVALGHHHSGLISNHNVLAHELENAAEHSGDKVWRLPLTDEYMEQIESPFADIANIGERSAGAITAGAFLSHFTKKYYWAHLDIAGTAWKSGKQKGATGRPVPLLMQYLLNKCHIKTHN